MTERADLLESMAATIADYREGESSTPNAEHVNRWVKQFDSAVQVPILREMNYVLKKTYFSRKRTRDFLNGLFQTKRLVGDDPCAFWKGVRFLDIQQGGASQKEMLALFETILEKRCSFSIKDCGAKATATGNHMSPELDREAFTDFVRALAFASRKHSLQRRKDADASPYINQPDHARLDPCRGSGHRRSRRALCRAAA
jgi:hypothetical protein